VTIITAPHSRAGMRILLKIRFINFLLGMGARPDSPRGKNGRSSESLPPRIIKDGNFAPLGARSGKSRANGAEVRRTSS
jgi:hypothetical protein